MGSYSAPPMADGATVLVIDDNVANRELARATLEDAGYQVVLAPGGAEGLAAFTAHAIDCVLLDFRMPGLDGPETCRRLRGLPGGDVPIVFVTAQRDVDTFDRARQAGGDDFVAKPYRPTELVTRVVAAVKLRRLAAERSDLYDQLKRQRDDLQRLQLQKEALVAYLVHDLKNPVGSIDLQAQLLLRDRDGSERARRAGARIRDDVRALLRMITTVLDLARADAGQLAPMRRAVDVTVLVGGVLDELDARAQAAGVHLTRELTATTVDADPELVRRVLENLVDNAIRHAPDGSEILVSAHRAGAGVELRVRDRGPGVAPERRVEVFERFTSTGTRTNRGLGLAFCKLAAEAHGGRIWVEDAGPGAAFCLWLPDDVAIAQP